ncbi:MAG: CIA30 family protein [Candidatus Marinimicrobia bacterium]|nr:CIA30 family protein [Candidatus Neomarinimicrobiota bacterium]MBT5097405.1 CIA30 family protein [Candidatus Neomarinimicrobiota bacterium]MDG2367429.1 CIA30 family protein [Candidatus Neomarinimicrobiota bacterium]
MKNILLANCLALLIGCDLPNVENSSAKFIEGEVIMEDFDSKNLLNWKIVNDSVMGGRSDATLKLKNNLYGVFNGYLSLQNNGGFSSIRAYYPPDLINVKSITIRIKGDGRQYSFRVRGNTSNWASYTHTFNTVKNKWIEKELMIKDFYPLYRGYYLNDMPLLSEMVIKEIGFMLSDKQTGPFELEIDWIRAN